MGVAVGPTLVDGVEACPGPSVRRATPPETVRQAPLLTVAEPSPRWYNGAWEVLFVGEPTLPIGEQNVLVSLAILLFSVLMVAFFSSSEASLISVSKIRIRSLAERGDRAAQVARDLWENHDKLFATILLTENAFIIFASSVGTTLSLLLFGEQGLLVASLAMTVLIVLFGEITPKTFAARNSERTALLVARPISRTIPTCI